MATERPYDLGYETRGGRCCWCWRLLGTTESHTVVRASNPPLELRFHHRCWPVYRALSGVGDRQPDPWTPQRVEELRIRGGFNAQEFARRLHVNPERLRRFQAGDGSALGPAMRRELDALARQEKFRESGIDWSDPRAFFCLCQHLRWSAADVHQHLGAAEMTVKSWRAEGVPRSRPNTWMRLTRLAAEHGFDAAMVVDDRLWTAELLDAAIAASGRPVSAWAARAGVSEHLVRNYRSGRNAITRPGAWCLTRAATAFGVPLPPVGRVNYARPPQERHVPANRKKRWTPEMTALLGTASDAEVARKLGRPVAGVTRQRWRLGIAPYRPPTK